MFRGRWNTSISCNTLIGEHAVSFRDVKNTIKLDKSARWTFVRPLSLSRRTVELTWNRANGEKKNVREANGGERRRQSCQHDRQLF